jgi:hypothetical protein
MNVLKNTLSCRKPASKYNLLNQFAQLVFWWKNYGKFLTYVHLPMSLFHKSKHSCLRDREKLQKIKVKWLNKIVVMNIGYRVAGTYICCSMKCRTAKCKNSNCGLQNGCPTIIYITRTT